MILRKKISVIKSKFIFSIAQCVIRGYLQLFDWILKNIFIICFILFFTSPFINKLIWLLMYQHIWYNYYVYHFKCNANIKNCTNNILRTSTKRNSFNTEYNKTFKQSYFIKCISNQNYFGKIDKFQYNTSI